MDEHTQQHNMGSCLRSLLTMSTPLPVTSYWTKADNTFLIEQVRACQIDIKDTSPATIEVIRNQWWVHKSAHSFHNNYRKVLSDIHVKRQVKGGSGKRMVEFNYFMIAPH
jgi:hypothetical protein